MHRNSLSWSDETLDDVAATIMVDTAGEHTVNVWMREDGFMLDKILLSRVEGFLPHDEGPPESLREGVGAPAGLRDGGKLMIAQELEVSLHMTFVEVRQKRHEFITVEHLLLAVIDNPSA